MHTSPVVALGMSVLALTLAAVFVFAVYRAAPLRSAASRRRLAVRTGALTVIWMALFALAATSGWLARFDQRPPPMALMLIASLGAGLLLGFSRIGSWLSTLPLAGLVGWQAFRLPLELLMHEAASEGLMPRVMSFGGYNFDIVTGATALVLGLVLTWTALPRVVIVAWNVMGTVLLSVVLIIAVASSPLFRAFGADQINDWVAYFPYVWLPSVLVVSAVMGHVVIARRLLAERRGTSAGKRGDPLIEARS